MGVLCCGCVLVLLQLASLVPQQVVLQGPQALPAAAGPALQAVAARRVKPRTQTHHPLSPQQQQQRQQLQLLTAQVLLVRWMPPTAAKPQLLMVRLVLQQHSSSC